MLLVNEGNDNYGRHKARAKKGACVERTQRETAWKSFEEQCRLEQLSQFLLRVLGYKLQSGQLAAMENVSIDLLVGIRNTFKRIKIALN